MCCCPTSKLFRYMSFSFCRPRPCSTIFEFSFLLLFPLQATLERSETDTRKRLTSQLEKQEREISQLQKRLEHEVEQRHLLNRNQDVSTKLSGCFCNVNTSLI